MRSNKCLTMAVGSDMTTRVLPPPDIFASCPLDGRILEFYRNTFEAVYVSLNPFILPITLDKDEFKPGTYPSRASIAAKCRPVSWTEVMRLTGLSSLAAVDIALRTRSGGLKQELRNEAYAAALDTLIETHSILPPPEGSFSDLLHDRVLHAIQALSQDWLWIGDEFCTERRLQWIEDLKNQDQGLTSGRFNIFTPDKSLLWTIHWDSHFSFLCSSRDNLITLVQKIELEGFFCTDATEVYWSLLS